MKTQKRKNVVVGSGGINGILTRLGGGSMMWDVADECEGALDVVFLECGDLSPR